MPSASMLDHLGSNVTWLVPIWRMTSTVGSTVAAYAAHTRNILYDSVTYSAAQVESTRFSETLGVQQANHIELFGIFDSIVTEENLQGGKWRNAKVVFEYIAIDPATGVASLTVTGSIKKIKGQVGKVTINNGTFTAELRSLSDLLHQEIGDLTSSLARQRQLSELITDVAPYTFARTVTAVADRRNFTVGGAAQVNDYFKYGKVTFTSGANNGRSMEIKANAGNAIEIQLPMLSTITIGDTVSLLAGFDGTREQARDKFGAAENLWSEPDLPGLRAIIEYPE